MASLRDRGGIETRRLALVPGCPADLLNNFTRVTGPERTPTLFEGSNKLVHDCRVVREIRFSTLPPKDLVKLCGRGVVQLRLSVNAPQKRLVRKLTRIEARREYYEHVKGDK